MTSYNNNNFQRSMFGINTIKADDIDTTNLNTDNIITKNLNITVSGTGITMPLGDNSLALATTAYVQESAHVEENKYTWSTGLHSGGVLSVVSNTEIGITDGNGTIITNQLTRDHQAVSWTGLNSITVPNISSSIVHFVYIDINGNPQFQITRPTESELRSFIFLGVAVALDKINITIVNQEQQYISNPSNLVQDLFEIIGFINKDGNQISANSNGSIVKASGEMAGFGINYYNDVSNPNVLNLPMLNTQTDNVLQIRLYTGESINPAGAPYLLPVDSIDTGIGSLVLMQANKFSVGRMYVFTSNTIKFQVGQKEYNSMILAKEQYLFDPFITEPSIVENGLLIVTGTYSEVSTFTYSYTDIPTFKIT